MVKLIVLRPCRPEGPLLDGEMVLPHQPTVRACVVNVVEHSPSGEVALDRIDELSVDRLADFACGSIADAQVYATTEHVQKACARSVPLGVRSGGVKLVCAVQRRSGLSHAEFVDHWLHRHVSLALVHHPGLSRYVTNVVDERLSETGEDWDGFAELHFASDADLTQRMYDSPAGREIIATDVARFIGRGVAYRVAEYVRALPA